MRNVVATIEVPDSHQGSERPAVKYSATERLARRAKKSPTAADAMNEATNTSPSSAVSSTRGVVSWFDEGAERSWHALAANAGCAQPRQAVPARVLVVQPLEHRVVVDSPAPRGYDARMPRFVLVSLVVFSSACGPAVHRVVMNAENNSGQSGFALLTPLSGVSTRVELDILPGNDPRPVAAHVHKGRCGEIGDIEAGLYHLKPNPAAAGHFTSTTEVPLALDALLKGTFAINVHDARDFSLYVSCGEIK